MLVCGDIGERGIVQAGELYVGEGTGQDGVFTAQGKNPNAYVTKPRHLDDVLKLPAHHGRAAQLPAQD